MWVKAYKLLRSNMTSINGHCNHTISYEIGKLHHSPKNTLGLFVFETLHHATTYSIDLRYYFDCYECVVKDPYRVPRIADASLEDNAIDFYYDINRYGAQFSKRISPPNGTLLTTELILLNKVG